MSGTQPIIDRILEDARVEAERILEDGKRRADSIRTAAQERARAAADAAIARAERDANVIVEGRRTVAALEVKKIALASRRNVLDAAFSRALDRLVELPIGEHEDFLASLIDRNAEYDDVILLSERCPVERSFIMAIPVYESKKLVLSKERGKFAGGLKLIGKSYDKNLTFENLLAETRARIESEIAAQLGE